MRRMSVPSAGISASSSRERNADLWIRNPPVTPLRDADLWIRHLARRKRVARPKVDAKGCAFGTTTA